MSLDPQFLEILACPDTHHAPLDYDPAAQTLTCTQCRRVFEIRDGIPVLLLDQARPPTAGMAESVSGDAWPPGPSAAEPPPAGHDPGGAGEPR